MVHVVKSAESDAGMLYLGLLFLLMDYCEDKEGRDSYHEIMCTQYGHQFSE